MQKIIIRNLRLRCLIGINPDEQKEKQDVLINVVIWADLSKALKSDQIADTINYWEVNKNIIHLVEDSKFNLVESVADKIADICLEDKRANRAKVRVEKTKALKSAESVGVEIIKERK